jgi:hypothetical protein
LLEAGPGAAGQDEISRGGRCEGGVVDPEPDAAQLLDQRPFEVGEVLSDRATVLALVLLALLWRRLPGDHNAAAGMQHHQMEVQSSRLLPVLAALDAHGALESLGQEP